MNPIKKTFQYGEHEVSLETGEIARQADGAVFVNMGETVVMVTVVARKTADPGRDFFPLTVDYIPVVTSFPCPYITSKKPTPRVEFPVVFSNAKGDPAKRKHSLVV